MTGAPLVAFWVVVVGLGFVAALAVQLRILAGMVLARAALVRDPRLSPSEARAAVPPAASGRVPEDAPGPLADAVRHLIDVYPNPLRHIRTARTATWACPFAMLAIIALRRGLESVPVG